MTINKGVVVAFILAVAAVIMGVYRSRDYRQDKAACEAEGRFYWRGQCLPNECRFDIHP